MYGSFLLSTSFIALRSPSSIIKMAKMVPAMYKSRSRSIVALLLYFHVFYDQKEACVSLTMQVCETFPRLGYFPSPKGLYFYSDCALFNFSYVTYTYDESCTHRKARFGIVTAVCVSVFLARLLLMCMDVESNPGPGLRDTQPGKLMEQHAAGLGCPYAVPFWPERRYPSGPQHRHDDRPV